MEWRRETASGMRTALHRYLIEGPDDRSDRKENSRWES